MRHTRLLLLAVSASLLPLGCGTNASSIPSRDSKISNANDKIREAADATSEAAKEKRDAFTREMHKKLDELDAKYDDLKTRASKSEGHAKIELEKKLEVAKVKRDAAGKKLTELKEAGADRWEKVKDGVSHAYHDLKKVFE